MSTAHGNACNPQKLYMLALGCGGSVEPPQRLQSPAPGAAGRGRQGTTRALKRACEISILLTPASYALSSHVVSQYT